MSRQEGARGSLASTTRCSPSPSFASLKALKSCLVSSHSLLTFNDARCLPPASQPCRRQRSPDLYGTVTIYLYPPPERHRSSTCNLDSWRYPFRMSTTHTPLPIFKTALFLLVGFVPFNTLRVPTGTIVISYFIFFTSGSNCSCQRRRQEEDQTRARQHQPLPRYTAHSER